MHVRPIVYYLQNNLGPKIEHDIAKRRMSIKDFIKYSTPEVKLITLFSYYSITVILLLIHLVISLRLSDTAVENAAKFALCSAGGYRSECDEYKKEIHRKLIPSIIFDLISTMFVALVNGINLLYVIQYKDIKTLKRSFTASLRKYKLSTANEVM